jgi:malate dehydrogenase
MRAKLGFPGRRVIGMAGVLDSARFSWFLAEATGSSVKDVDAMVLGAHGDSMVPMPRACTVNGVPALDLIDRATIEALADRTRNGGAEIVALLKSGSAYYAPAAAVAQMVDSILADRNEILPCAAQLNGQYGVDGLFVGVPVKLGRSGISQVVEIELTADEKVAFDRSADAVRELVEAMARLAAQSPG